MLTTYGRLEMQRRIRHQEAARSVESCRQCGLSRIEHADTAVDHAFITHDEGGES